MASASIPQRLLSIGTKIIAVGRNYAAHAKELGNAVPKEPVLFMKPTSSYLQNGGTIEIPKPLDSLDHEVELAVVMGQKARDVSEAAAMDHVGGGFSVAGRIMAVVHQDWKFLTPSIDGTFCFLVNGEGYAVALDMTAREIQSSAKSSGLPWTVAKGHDTFTPIGTVLPKSMITNPENLELWLKVDDELRQKGSTKDMIFKIPFLISHISSIMTLMEGDVILTGTPQGVGPVRTGQKISAGITGFEDVSFNVHKRHKP